MATAVKTWSTNETLTASDLNAEFSNVYSSAVDLTSAQTISGIKTHSADIILQDSVNLTFGTGGDADLYYDGTDVILDPQVVGSGVFRVLNEAEVRGDAGAAGILTLSTAETTVVDGDKLGQIDFQAPLEADGTDSIAVGASIWAEADDTFGAALNDTDLVFAVAESETAAERMRLSYDGTNTALSFTTATAIDTGGNNALTLNAGTGALTVTAGDITLYDDNNNADASVSIGTSATERLEIATLNGAANKTAEEVRFTTYTASATADHGQFGFYVDETLIANIDDGGINLPSGKVFSVNGTDIAFDSTAAISLTNTLTVGVDDTGYDVQFFGATSGKYWQWDESADEMYVVGSATIGTLTPGTSGDGTLHVHSGSAGTVSAGAGADDLVVENSGQAAINIITPNNVFGLLYFTDPDAEGQGGLQYDHSNDILHMRANGGNRISVSSAGVVTIPQLTASQDVQTDGSSNLVSVSDKTWKNDLGVIRDGLSIVRAIDPHYFTWNRDAEGNTRDSSGKRDIDGNLVMDYKSVFDNQPRLAGFFAQDVYRVFPEGSPGGPNTDENGQEHWGLNSRALLAAVWAAVRELDAKIS